MHASLLQRIGLRADLQEAIANRQFVLKYQPIFNIGDGQLVGVEALVRWQHPVRGLLPPSEFIGLAEESGLIVPAVVAGLLDAQARAGTDRSTRGHSVGDPARHAVPVRVAARGRSEVGTVDTSVPAGAVGRRGTET